MTLPALSPLNMTELAARVALHGAVAGGLSAVVTTSTANAAAELSTELADLTDESVRLLSVTADVDAMITAIADAPSALFILHCAPALATAAWTDLDQLRNRLDRDRPIVLVLRPEEFEALQERAPNLSSWLGGRVWRLDESGAHLHPEDIERRLAVLRAAFGMSDESVVSAARAGRLTPEPEFAEWLVLLGKGDLLR